jgi:hypothetical protein
MSWVLNADQTVSRREQVLHNFYDRRLREIWMNHDYEHVLYVVDTPESERVSKL